MQCTHLLLLICTSYMENDWSTDQFIKNHGDKELQNTATFQFQTRTSQACKYRWKQWKWVSCSLVFYLNKEFHLISSLLQFGSWKLNVFKPPTAKAIIACARKLYSSLWKLLWSPQLIHNAISWYNLVQFSTIYPKLLTTVLWNPQVKGQLKLNCIQVSQYSNVAAYYLIFNLQG